MDPLKVTWENFRGFTEPTTLDFPRITLLIGRNNVGKTSAYTPLLFMRQTLDASDRNTALLSRGELMDAGQYKDFVSYHDTGRQVSFGLKFPRDLLVDSMDPNPPTELELTFDLHDGRTRLVRHRISGRRGQPLVSRLRERTSESFNVTSNLLPTGQAVGRPLREVTELRRTLRAEQPGGFLFEGVGGLLIPRTWRENPERWNKVRGWFNAASELYTVQQSMNRTVRTLLRGIAYLGPLRSLPQATYRLAPEPPHDVGITGQYAPELLYRLRNDDVIEHVNQWLRQLGYGELGFESLGDEYFQVYLNHPEIDLRVNLAHSGIGLSQILPLLVQGVYGPEEGLLIAQQPEIHLNPAQQGLATDFLITVAAQRNRRVVVETHSEHVLLRLRRRVAEGQISHSDVAIYYFDNSLGQTLAERIPLDYDGQISRDVWPEGFFEDQLTDSFALALAQSRQGGKSQ